MIGLQGRQNIVSGGEVRSPGVDLAPNPTQVGPNWPKFQI